MKTDIITVFKSENCGSFLQAWAFKEQLIALGCDVRFCDYENSGNTVLKKIVAVAKCCIRLNFRRAIEVAKKTCAYRKLQKKLKVINSGSDAEAYFYGSDTLWNFEDSFFCKNAPFFTGADIKAPCYSFSVSVASTSSELLASIPEVVENIKKFKRIAIRDSHTEQVLRNFYTVDKITRTVDPTMLIKKDRYVRQFTSKEQFPDKRLVVYHFGGIEDEMWKALLCFAEKNRLKIVNVGMHRDCDADKSVIAIPQNFITAFEGAEYIFTNTFHGCVFSTIFNKPFATDGIHKKKIEGFLEEFGLVDRVVSSPADVESVFEAPIDYGRVNSFVEEKRKASIEYLESCIREVSENE